MMKPITLWSGSASVQFDANTGQFCVHLNSACPPPPEDESGEQAFRDVELSLNQETIPQLLSLLREAHEAQA